MDDLLNIFLQNKHHGLSMEVEYVYKQRIGKWYIAKRRQNVRSCIDLAGRPVSKLSYSY